MTIPEDREEEVKEGEKELVLQRLGDCTIASASASVTKVVKEVIRVHDDLIEKPAFYDKYDLL